MYCIDNLDPFYDVAIKLNNLRNASKDPHYHFIELDISDVSPDILLKRFENISFEAIIHLAARAGVRPSITHPSLYCDVNVKGTLQLLEFARLAGIPQFLFASSSSVYGTNPNVPWKESDSLYQPISPYAATKIAGEEIGKVYAHLYPIHFIALRLFTVYGPRQRPDLAIHHFYNLIKTQQPINLYGNGTTKRDYTYISDTVAGIKAALHFHSKGATIFNLGNNRQIPLIDLIRQLEECMGIKAIINWLSEQPGDVKETYADISKAQQLLSYQPNVTFEEGILQFVKWKENLQLIAG